MLNIQELKKEIKNKFSSPFTKKHLVFFLLYAGLLIAGVGRWISVETAILLSLVDILLWKIVVGLSWTNVIYLLAGLGEFFVLSLFLRRPFLLLFLILFLIILFRKLFFTADKWRIIANYYLCFWGIFISLALYYFLNLPFWLGLIFYLITLFIFFYLYLLPSQQKFNKQHLILLLLSVEIYWLFSFLALPVPFSAVLLFIHYYLFILFSRRLKGKTDIISASS